MELYDAVKREMVGGLNGHMNAAEKVTFSTDGKRVITTCSGRQVKLWDIATRQELLGWSNVDRALKWTEDGSTIIMAHRMLVAPTLDEIEAIEANSAIENRMLD